MARYFDVHPDNPQPRSLHQIVDILQDDGLIAYPTDSAFALGVRLGNRDGLERMRRIRGLDERHHFTIVVDEFAKLGEYTYMDNRIFRAVKASTPGPFTFILPATKAVPRAMAHPKKRTIGVRVPEHTTTLALLAALGEPLVSTTLILPGETEPMSDGWLIKDTLDHELDAVLDSGDAGVQSTTVIDLSGDEPEIVRRGAGDPVLFES